MKLSWTFTLLVAATAAAGAASINIGSTSDGGLDGTDVDNWTTNDLAFVDPQPGPTNLGLAFNWENVTTNTATIDSANNEFDFTVVANANWTGGHGYLFNESFDLSQTTGGITGLTVGFDFNASTLTNWSPLMAVNDGSSTKYYRWNHSNNSFNGNASLFGNSFLQNASLNAAGTTWGELVDTTGGWGTTRLGSTNPNLQATTGTVQFGFIQWGASSGNSANLTGTIGLDQIEWEVTYDPIPEPGAALLGSLAGLVLLRRRR